METGKYCAYNVTRNALLSDQVTVAEPALGSLQILGLVMHGPGAHQESAVWLTGLSRPPDLPRVVSFDILYLDEAKRVIACGSVGQDTDYPELHETATSALILADQRLAQTATAPGDQLQICREADLPAILKAASHSTVKVQDTSADAGPGRSIPAMMQFEVIRPAQYVHEPFVGSLMYLPEFPGKHSFSTELFLQPQEAAPQANIEIIEAIEPVAETTAVPLEATSGPTPLAEPPTEANSETPATTVRADQKEPPRFYHPEPIRFFDPAAAAAENQNTAETPEEPVPNEATPTHSGNVLPPELKSAIQHIDELFRQEQSSKQKGTRKKKAAAKSKSAKETAFEASGSGHPQVLKPEPEPPFMAPVAETPAELPPPLTEPLESPEFIPAPRLSWRSATPVELPTASPPVDIQAELTAAPSASEPPPLAASAEEEAQLTSEPEPAEPLSALAETTAEIGLIEASLSVAAEITPEALIPSAPPEPAPIAAATPPIQAMPVARFDETTVISARPPTHVEHIEEPRVIPATPPGAARRAEEGPAIPDKGKKQKPEKPSKPKLPLGTRILRWLDANPLDGKRRGERVHQPGLVAFYWSGGAPRPHEIINISKSGFYLRTREFWSQNTLVRMTLQRPSAITRDLRSISVLARVVRIDEDGVGHEFVTTEDLVALRSREIVPESGTNQADLESFLKPE